MFRRTDVSLYGYQPENEVRERGERRILKALFSGIHEGHGLGMEEQGEGGRWKSPEKYLTR